MGNICSRSKNEPDAFSSPGRVLGSSAAANTPAAPRASLPAKSNWESPGRTLGSTDTQTTTAAAGGGAGYKGSSDNADARANAALAAQKRAETTSKGKLGSQLAAQKAKTHAQTLNDVSQEERAVRDADDASAARRWE